MDIDKFIYHDRYIDIYACAKHAYVYEYNDPHLHGVCNKYPDPDRYRPAEYMDLYGNAYKYFYKHQYSHVDIYVNA